MSAPTPAPGSRHAALHVALALVARVGTAVTIAALLVVTGSVLTFVAAERTPTEVSTAGR